MFNKPRAMLVLYGSLKCENTHWDLGTERHKRLYATAPHNNLFFIKPCFSYLGHKEAIKRQTPQQKVGNWNLKIKTYVTLPSPGQRVLVHHVFTFPTPVMLLLAHLWTLIGLIGPSRARWCNTLHWSCLCSCPQPQRCQDALTMEIESHSSSVALTPWRVKHVSRQAGRKVALFSAKWW